jgi:hypothetical protein
MYDLFQYITQIEDKDKNWKIFYIYNRIKKNWNY